MKNMDLLKVINDIDDKYVTEALPNEFKEKKTFSIFKYIPAFFVLLFATCISINLIKKEDENVTIVNPLVEYSSLNEACDAVGFDFSFMNDNTDSISYIVIDNEILEINIGDITYRKALGNEDVSGDSNKYDDEKIVSIDGVGVTFKEYDSYILCIFNFNNHSYSISGNVSYDAMYQMASYIIKNDK